MKVDLSNVSTPQLRAIKGILEKGVVAKAEAEGTDAQDKSYLCHKSPPKGYPKNKSDYGDSECFRYPLNTKSRCLAAWRYVHHAENKAILGAKFSKVEGRIKRYAKEHYSLDLQVGESEEFDWGQIFMEYYDAETMGERCELIELESEEVEASDETSEVKMEKELETVKQQLEEKETELGAKTTELESMASQVNALTEELNALKTEVESLRTFKEEKEKEAVRAELLKLRKAKVEESGLDVDIESEVDKWLDMSDETFEFTINQMADVKKGAKAEAGIKVPNVSTQTSDAIDTVREGFRELKNERKK
jgi:hypothetical protein